MYLNTPETDADTATQFYESAKATGAPTPSDLLAIASPRMDLYMSIHKAIRQMMFDAIYRVGRVDVTDEAELYSVLAQVEALLQECESHINRENDFVHPAIESREAGSSRRIMEEHFEHLDAIDALRRQMLALRDCPVARRAQVAHKLYLHLTTFVADNLTHMHVEESMHNQVLWSKFNDGELGEIHGRILATVDEIELKELLKWMAPAITHQERVGMFGGMQSQMPAEALRELLDSVQPTLETGNWDKLARALNIPQVPGLVDFR